MGNSYPDKTNSSGIWKINEIIFETCDDTGTFTGIMNYGNVPRTF